MRIIHISDPHLSSLEGVRLGALRGKRLLGYQSWYRKRRHQYRHDTLLKVTRAVRDESADLVIVSGDLVHIGLESELREASDWLETLGSPDEVLLTPGNHDCYHPESWPLVQRLYQPYLGAAMSSDPAGAYPLLKRSGDVSIITASSATPSAWWAASGTLGPEQRNRLNDMLHDERGRLRILVLHHPPLPGMTSARKALTDARELKVIFEDASPDITLHGHLHRNQSLDLSDSSNDGRIFCTAPTSSVRADAPASYRIFNIHPQNGQWRIDMTLKSLVRDKVEVVEEMGWVTARSFNSGEGKDAGTQ